MESFPVSPFDCRETPGLSANSSINFPHWPVAGIASALQQTSPAKTVSRIIFVNKVLHESRVQ